MTKKKILLINRTAPYGSALAKDALDATLAAAVYEQDLSVVFMDDGVFQLSKNQLSDALQQKNFASMLTAFPLYDINKIYVCSDSLNKRSLSTDDLVIDTTPLSGDQLRELVAEQDNLLCF